MIFYIVGLFVIILSIVMIFYFSASENTRIKILDILQVYGSILGLVSVFLVTYDRFISKQIEFIQTITEFNSHLGKQFTIILNDFKNPKLHALKREIFNNQQQNELKKTVVTDEEFIMIYKIFIILNNLFKKYQQERNLLKKQVEFKVFFSFIEKSLRSNKVNKFWDIQHHNFSKNFVTFINSVKKHGIKNIDKLL